MRAALIENGVVTNIVSISNPAHAPAGYVVISDPAEIGFVYAGGVFTAPPVTLADARKSKRQELKIARDDAILADVTIGTRTWPSDDAFKLKLAAITARLVRGKPAPAKLRGTTGPAINTPTLAQLDTIDDAIAAQEAAAWDRYWLLNDAVQAAFNAGDAVAINTVTW
jgi:hypothetical protein